MSVIVRWSPINTQTGITKRLKVPTRRWKEWTHHRSSETERKIAARLLERDNKTFNRVEGEGKTSIRYQICQDPPPIYHEDWTNWRTFIVKFMLLFQGILERDLPFCCEQWIRSEVYNYCNVLASLLAGKSLFDFFIMLRQDHFHLSAADTI